VRKKIDMDREVAADLGISQRQVSTVTAAFLNQVKQAIVHEGGIFLDEFGRFNLVISSGGKRVDLNTLRTQEIRTVEVPTKARVHFSKTTGFKELIHEKLEQEKVMEKYGVNENINSQQLEKQAAQGCPECGDKLSKHGSVLVCPTHGTEPFESATHGSKEEGS